MFQTTLFRALAVADEALCNGSAVVSKSLDLGSALPPFVDLADGSTLYLRDDVLSIDADGRAYGEQDGQPVVWRFRVMQPLTAGCVATIDAPRPDVIDVVGRLRSIQARGRRTG